MKVAVCLAVCAFALAGASASAQEVIIPKEVHLPVLEPLIAPCSDPAADRFLEIDISQRPPANATRVQKVGGWVSPDGIFHWPLVMRIRNIGDRPFRGKPGKQFVVVIEDDLLANRKGRVVGRVPFDRIEPRGGVAARFQFEASVDAVNKQRFRRRFTLKIDYAGADASLLNGANGDCNRRNDEWSILFDGSRPGWIHAK